MDMGNNNGPLSIAVAGLKKQKAKRKIANGKSDFAVSRRR
jgi:hypothetical protein